jgi:AraC-like DNA-binding protein
MREQPTLRHALQGLARYGNRMNNAMFLTLEETPSVCVLRGELVGGGDSASRQASELIAAVVFLSLREVFGESWKPLRVFFTHAAPSNPAVHRRVFGDAVEYGQDFNGIAWARDRLDIPNRKADPILARYAHDLVEATFSERRTVSDQVRELVLSQLASGKSSVELAAGQLGISRRTLHRQLAPEGHTFSGIVDDVRRELARRYMADKHRSLAEVSELLGFAAPSAFSRWYRRHLKDTASRKRPARAPIS